MTELIGDLHPMVVHFPIALLMTSVMCWLTQYLIKDTVSNTFFRITSAMTLKIGFLFSIVTYVKGYLHSMYWEPESLLDWHGYMALLLTIYAGVMSFLIYPASRYYWMWMVVLGILVGITGHYGGTLTHGPLF